MTHLYNLELGLEALGEHADGAGLERGLQGSVRTRRGGPVHGVRLRRTTWQSTGAAA
jgi:hypothetical protein